MSKDLQQALGEWAVGMNRALGPAVLRELTRFSRLADAGAMITVRCTRSGFTAQVTGPIVSNQQPTQLTLDFVEDMIREM